MFAIYLAFLIFGGILLGASFFSFGDGHSEITDTSGSDLTHDLNHGGSEIDNTDANGHITKFDNHIGKEITKGGFSSEAAQFFSFRNFTYFSAFFGLTGTILSLIGFGSISTFLSSLGLGTFSYLSGFFLMKYLRNSESGEEIKLRDLIGKSGIVEIDIKKNKQGKVIINIGSQISEYNALLSEASKSDLLKRKENIIVIDISSNILIVDKIDF